MNEKRTQRMMAIAIEEMVKHYQAQIEKARNEDWKEGLQQGEIARITGELSMARQFINGLEELLDSFGTIEEFIFTLLRDGKFDFKRCEHQHVHLILNTYFNGGYIAFRHPEEGPGAMHCPAHPVRAVEDVDAVDGGQDFHVMLPNPEGRGYIRVSTVQLAIGYNAPDEEVVDWSMPKHLPHPLDTFMDGWHKQYNLEANSGSFDLLGVLPTSNDQMGDFLESIAGEFGVNPDYLMKALEEGPEALAGLIQSRGEQGDEA
jgi:hypothetical protein